MVFVLATESSRPYILEVMHNARRSETADVITSEASTGGTTGLVATAGGETILTTAEWNKANNDLDTLLYLTVGKAGGALADLIRKFKSQT